MVISGRFVKRFAFIFGITLVSLTASAFSYKMNAMCYLQDTKGSSVKPFNPTQQEIKESDSSFVRKTPTNVTAGDVETKFRIASVSKVLTTHWAIAKLGPEYRFKTKLSISPTKQNNSCDVHLSGDMDIFMGKEMLASTFQQLKPILASQNCRTISLLTYDELFVVPFYSPGKLFILQHRSEEAFRGSDPTLFYGPKTTLKALTYFVRNFGAIPVGDIKPVSSSEFKKYAQEAPLKVYSFRSRPLYMMMREYNAFSSNVPPSILFDKLGGQEAYKTFIKTRLNLDTDTVEMFNGSGYPLTVDNDKSYNEVSCEGIVKVLQDLDHMLNNYKGTRSFQMADVMAVGGNGEAYSTFKNLYASDTFKNTLTAKTGSADRAITFAGMLSTTDGHLYFGVLTEPDSYEPSQLIKPRTYIRDLVTILAERYHLKKFSYNQLGLMEPTDDASKFTLESANLSTHLK
ncbi:MAG: D-alanyl-D-alanine carboxypeptidase [Pseudobdellovibrionaceae bacterium]